VGGIRKGGFEVVMVSDISRLIVTLQRLSPLGLLLFLLLYHSSSLFILISVKNGEI
jgi:hypothetical protein